jgi:hypothetical protein
MPRRSGEGGEKAQRQLLESAGAPRETHRFYRTPHDVVQPPVRVQAERARALGVHCSRSGGHHSHTLARLLALTLETLDRQRLQRGVRPGVQPHGAARRRPARERARQQTRQTYDPRCRESSQSSESGRALKPLCAAGCAQRGVPVVCPLYSTHLSLARATRGAAAHGRDSGEWRQRPTVRLCFLRHFSSATKQLAPSRPACVASHIGHAAATPAQQQQHWQHWQHERASAAPRCIVAACLRAARAADARGTGRARHTRRARHRLPPHAAFRLLSLLLEECHQQLVHLEVVPAHQARQPCA